MENEPSNPGDTTHEENNKEETSGKKSGDAAAISARILALQGDSDEYAYKEPPPKPVAPVVTPKARAKSQLTRVMGVIGLLVLGGLLTIPMVKLSISRGTGIGARLQKWFGSPPVAIINGEAITAEDFAHSSEIASGRTAMQRLIDDALVRQYATKIGVVPDPKDVDAKFKEATLSPSFFQNLKRVNESQEDYKKTLFVTMCKQAIVSNGIKVNPGEVRNYYDRNIDKKNPTARFYHPESVQASVIINQSKEALENAQKDIAGGMNWANAVQKYSADSSKTRNGVLPPVRKGKVDGHKFPNLEKTLFDLQNGNTSDITQIGGFFWLIKCINHMPETIDPYDKVQEACTTGLLVERGLKKNAEEINKQEKDFVKASTITVIPEQYADLSPKH